MLVVHKRLDHQVPTFQVVGETSALMVFSKRQSLNLGRGRGTVNTFTLVLVSIQSGLAAESPDTENLLQSPGLG